MERTRERVVSSRAGSGVVCRDVLTRESEHGPKHVVVDRIAAADGRTKGCGVLREEQRRLGRGMVVREVWLGLLSVHRGVERVRVREREGTVDGDVGGGAEGVRDGVGVCPVAAVGQGGRVGPVALRLVGDNGLGERR